MFEVSNRIDQVRYVY